MRWGRGGEGRASANHCLVNVHDVGGLLSYSERSEANRTSRPMCYVFTHSMVSVRGHDDAYAYLYPRAWPRRSGVGGDEDAGYVLAMSKRTS